MVLGFEPMLVVNEVKYVVHHPISLPFPKTKRRSNRTKSTIVNMITIKTQKANLLALTQKTAQQ